MYTRSLCLWTHNRRHHRYFKLIWALTWTMSLSLSRQFTDIHICSMCRRCRCCCCCCIFSSVNFLFANDKDHFYVSTCVFFDICNLRCSLFQAFVLCRLTTLHFFLAFLSFMTINQKKEEECTDFFLLFFRCRCCRIVLIIIQDQVYWRKWCTMRKQHTTQFFLSHYEAHAIDEYCAVFHIPSRSKPFAFQLVLP